MENFLQGLPPKKKKMSDEKRSKMTPWVEKYRPKTVEEVSHQNEIVAVMKQCLINKELPNFLFYGPPGTGKTSIILAMARQMFGTSFSDRVLELNASDERGIDVIRTKVKNFASLALPEVSNVPPYKLIILDEADSMTPPAQAALRRTMETEMKTTRFCLTCNYVTKIINPITSRCAMFRFKKLDDEIPLKRLREISEKENLTVSDEDLIYIMNISEGDLRKGITLLQSASYLSADFKVTDGVKNITISRQLIIDISSVIPKDYELKYIEALNAYDIDQVCQLAKELIKDGFSIQRFITQIFEALKDSGSKFKALNDSKRATILMELAKSEYRIVDGADEYLQFLSFSAEAIKQLS